MKDIIVIIIVGVVFVFGLYSTMQHFKGKSSCCGSSSVKLKKKKLKNVIYKKTFKVEGMSCEHCANRVQSCIDAIDGVSASVNLKKNEVVISYEKDVDTNMIVQALSKYNYFITEC